MNIYPDIVHEDDLSPDAFGPEIDEACEEIHKACKGFGTDEKRLINALATKSPEDRAKISMKFKEMYGKDLIKLVKSEVKGDLGLALQFLSVPSDVAECEMIRKATKGLGTSERILYPIICGRTNTEIDILKKSYFNHFTQDLGRKLDSELGGDFEKLIFTCLQGTQEEFDPEYHTEEKVAKDAKEIYEAGQGSFGTDEAAIFKILCSAPIEHLKAVNLKYAEDYGYTLFKGLEIELGGKCEEAGLFLLGMKLKPYQTVAGLIDKACKGFGTSETLLTSTLIRYQLILKQVDEAHTELYGQNLADRVKKECRGKYEDVLLAVIDAA